MDPLAYREMAETEGRHWWFVARRRILAGVIESLDLPADAAILEVGAGTGGNLAMLSGFGRVSAMELDPFAREHASGTTGVAVQAGSLPDDIPFPGQKFDLVCMFDVLEHVEHDAAALRALAHLLNPGGRIVVTVPAYMWMWSEHDETLHHFRRYSRARLRSDLAAAGFIVEKATHFNALLFPLAAVARGVAKVLRLTSAPGRGTPPPVVNGILAAIFGLERHVLRRGGFPFGLSLLAVAGPR